jgi:hypothetical protein
MSFIRIHRRAHVPPDFAPSLADVSIKAMADRSTAFVGYSLGYFYLVSTENFGLIMRPLSWFSDRIETWCDENNKVVALKVGNSVCDLRTPNEGFLITSPCLYCGAENDRGHDLIKHVDKFLGRKT